MKKIIYSLIFFCIVTIKSINAQTEFKFNVLTTAFLIPNAGFEIQLTEKSSFQFDALASFWDSVNGSPLQVIQVFPEYRRYFKQNMRGFFVGAHVGVGMFTLSKYGYSNNIHQSGRNTYYGITLGYKMNIGKNWALEVFVGGGSQQAHYRAYNHDTGERVDNLNGLDKRPFNASGELIPYRGGVMFVYRIPSRQK